MESILDRLEEELDEAKGSIQRTAGRLEDSTLEAGRATKEAVDRFFFELDKRLAMAIMAARDYAIQAELEGDDLWDGLVEDMGSLRDSLRSKRPELTEEEDEEGAFKAALSDLEQGFDAVIDRLQRFRGDEGG